jgi:hypothetical protein
MTVATTEPRLLAARQVLGRMRKVAVRHPWTGDQKVHRRHSWLTRALTDPTLSTFVLFTFDVGHHASGWFRNSDYDRCFHLSVSHPDLSGPPGTRLCDVTVEEIRAWAIAAFGEDRRLSWFEPRYAASKYIRERARGLIHFDDQEEPIRDLRWLPPGSDSSGSEICHVRLFVDRHGQPIQPRGEVYNLIPWQDGTSPEEVFR